MLRSLHLYPCCYTYPFPDIPISCSMPRLASLQTFHHSCIPILSLTLTPLYKNVPASVLHAFCLALCTPPQHRYRSLHHAHPSELSVSKSNSCPTINLQYSLHPQLCPSSSCILAHTNINHACRMAAFAWNDSEKHIG